MSVCNDDKDFICNISLIKALMQFLPVSDRKKIQEWLKKLQEMADDMGDVNLRNEYTFYLLINAQNGSLSQPFNKSPPAGRLRPLCRILPDFLFEEVQKQLKVSYCRLNKMLNASNDNYEKPELKCEPSNFQREQPRPRKGVTASLAVFSNFDEGGSSC